MISSLIKKEIKKFGLIAVVFFGFLSGMGFILDKMPACYFFAVLVLCGIGFVIFPLQLQPVYNQWLKAAKIIGKVMTIIILSCAYYFVITPSAFLKRMLGGLPIEINQNSKKASYWVKKDEPAQSKDRFYKRY